IAIRFRNFSSSSGRAVCLIFNQRRQSPESRALSENTEPSLFAFAREAARCWYSLRTVASSKRAESTGLGSALLRSGTLNPFPAADRARLPHIIARILRRRPEPGPKENDMPAHPARQCHKSCKCSGGSVRTRIGLRVESGQAPADHGQ